MNDPQIFNRSAGALAGYPALSEVEGCGRPPRRASQAAKNSVLLLILGGAAVHRCDHPLGFEYGFSR